MCTLVVAHRFFPGAPLVVAANRDEFLARKSSGPKVHSGYPRVLMPRDEVAGGTWLGVNETGLFVGITNRAGSAPDPSRRSRGSLVTQALKAASASQLHRQLGTMDAGEFNPFHLLYADGQDAFVTWSSGERIAQYSVAPGVHIVTERSLGADDRGRTELLERLWRDRVSQKPASVKSLRELLVQHGADDAPMSGSCIHADGFGYGTRSSFIYLGSEEPIAAWCEGHPCTGSFGDLGALLGELKL